jgi:DNA-binding NarL/FixJ family response regulator
MIKVFITEDHRSYAEGLQLYLEQDDEISVVGCAIDGEQALDLLPELYVDVMILDLDMPGLNGQETLKILKADFPDIKVLVLTSYCDTCVIETMKKMGADGYRNKESGLEDIKRAVKNIHMGYLDYLVKENRHKPDVSLNYNTVKLTRRETEVVKYLAKGLAGKEIAEIMYLSEHTVESHAKTARLKTGAKNAAELVTIALKSGWI